MIKSKSFRSHSPPHFLSLEDSPSAFTTHHLWSSTPDDSPNRAMPHDSVASAFRAVHAAPSDPAGQCRACMEPAAIGSHIWCCSAVPPSSILYAYWLSGRVFVYGTPTASMAVYDCTANQRACRPPSDPLVAVAVPLPPHPLLLLLPAPCSHSLALALAPAAHRPWYGTDRCTHRYAVVFSSPDQPPECRDRSNVALWRHDLANNATRLVAFYKREKFKERESYLLGNIEKK